VSTVVAYREGQLDESIYYDPNADHDTHEGEPHSA